MHETWQATHDWGALTRAEIAAARDAGALPVLTVGAVEQHADHLPVDTDTLSAHRIALAACTTLASRGLEVGYANYMAPGQKQWLEVLPGALRGVGHACAYETALQLALRPPELADRIASRIGHLPPRLSPSYVAGNAPDVLRPAGAYWASIFAAGDVGYVGDPAAATKAAGEAMIEATVAALARFYADFATAQLRVGA